MYSQQTSQYGGANGLANKLRSSIAEANKDFNLIFDPIVKNVRWVR